MAIGWIPSPRGVRTARRLPHPTQGSEVRRAGTASEAQSASAAGSS